ncbi:MAG TPA: hypothetical protein VLK25_02805, partial [Allosphingosinicella sp.]|nr:hypothetical protein [Allosphingosinicella sp.]
ASLAALALAMSATTAFGQEPQHIAGALEDNDSQTGDEHNRYDDHVLRLEAGRRYRLSVNSDAFDPVARLYRAGEANPVAENDDSNESLNSRINYTPAQSGDFTLRVTSFSAEGRGAYNAQVALLPPLPPGVAVPWSVSGRIEDGDTSGGETARYDEHILRLEAGRRYVLTAEASDFDPFASLYRAGEDDPIAENDDSGGTLNSRIAFSPTESGDYVLRVAPLGGDGRGAYRAAAALAPPLPAPLTHFSRMEATIWRVYPGALTAADPQNDNGVRFDDYLIHFDAGQERLIELHAEGYDTVVQVYRASEREGEMLASNDDGGNTLNSLMHYRAEEAGDYIVRVTALGDASGPYRLRISER